MQAFADRAAISETLQTGLATFYSRSRKVRLAWIKTMPRRRSGSSAFAHSLSSS